MHVVVLSKVAMLLAMGGGRSAGGGAHFLVLAHSRCGSTSAILPLAYRQCNDAQQDEGCIGQAAVPILFLQSHLARLAWRQDLVSYVL